MIEKKLKTGGSVQVENDIKSIEEYSCIFTRVEKITTDRSI